MLIRNLIPSPKPLAAGWTPNNGMVLADTNGGLRLTTATSDTDCYAKLTIPVTAGASYMLTAEVSAVDDASHAYLGRAIRSYFNPGNKLGPVSADQSVGVTQVAFTATGGAARMELRLYGSGTAGESITWRHIGLYTADDWAAVRALGLAYFDGDTMPLAS